MSVAIAIHLLATLIWVGGMFFAHMILRPTANELFEPSQRLPLMLRVFDRFFKWVWLAVVSIIASGYWIFLGIFKGHMGLHVHLMQGVGWLMFLLFAYIWFFPYRRMRDAIGSDDLKLAGGQLAVIRKIVATNLVLGLITSVLGAGGRYF